MDCWHSSAADAGLVRLRVFQCLLFQLSDRLQTEIHNPQRAKVPHRGFRKRLRTVGRHNQGVVRRPLALNLALRLKRLSFAAVAAGPGRRCLRPSTMYQWARQAA